MRQASWPSFPESPDSGRRLSLGAKEGPQASLEALGWGWGSSKERPPGSSTSPEGEGSKAAWSVLVFLMPPGVAEGQTPCLPTVQQPLVTVSGRTGTAILLASCERRRTGTLSMCM